MRDPTAPILAIFAFQAAIVVAFGFVAWFWALARYPAAEMTSYTFLSPVFGVFFAGLILDEHLPLSIAPALLLTATGIYLVSAPDPVKPFRRLFRRGGT